MILPSSIILSFEGEILTIDEVRAAFICERIMSTIH
jgi:hypothetical protein